MNCQTFLPINLNDTFDVIRRDELSWDDFQLVLSTCQRHLVESDVKIRWSISAIVCQLD
jgi:hypothetical protein